MADEIKTRVAAAVRAARTKGEMSQADLAEAAGLSMEAISHIDRGASTPSLETFAALVRLLDLDASRLLGRKGLASISRERARLEAEVTTFAETLSDREIAKWLEFGRVMKSG